MKDIYLALSNALQSIPAIRWVDFDLGQLDAELPGVSYPCALIGFNGASYESTGTQTVASATLSGVLEVEVVLAFKIVEKTHSKSTYQAQGLEHLDIVNAVQQELVGLKGTSFDPLSLIALSNDPRPGIRVWRLGFACTHYPNVDTGGGSGGGGSSVTDKYLPWPTATPLPTLCVDPEAP